MVRNYEGVFCMSVLVTCLFSLLLPTDAEPPKVIEVEILGATAHSVVVTAKRDQ